MKRIHFLNYSYYVITGNELTAKGIGARVMAQQYASDVKTLRSLVENLYNGSQTKPLVIGPGGFFDAVWFSEFISKTTKSLQAVTHHIYNLGPGKYVPPPSPFNIMYLLHA